MCMIAAMTVCLTLAASQTSDAADRLHVIAKSLSPVPPPPTNPTNAFAISPAAALLGQLDLPLPPLLLLLGVLLTGNSEQDDGNIIMSP